MRVLVLGGTRFLGRAVVAEALARGDTVTTFTRGVSGPPPAPVEALHGDRADASALAQLRGHSFDLVVDTCGFVPSVVGLGASVLTDVAAHYVFVSSVNAYPDWPDQPVTADSRVWDCPPDATSAPAELGAAAPYGYLKSGCERAVADYFPRRCTSVRAGLLVGPHDNNGRMEYWLTRIARGGEVAVPGTPDQSLSVVDVRDLAQWMLATREVGPFNASGPPDMTTYREFFETVVRVTGADASLVWVPEPVIAEHGVIPWVELPLWLPSRVPHTFEIDTKPIVAAGFRQRPLADTVADTWSWLRAADRTPEDLDLDLLGGTVPGLSPEREATLIEATRRSA